MEAGAPLAAAAVAGSGGVAGILPSADAAALASAERANAAAASAAERVECEARYAAACAAAAAAGAPAPFRGPAADAPLGERFLDVVALVCANGVALDARPTRFVCGLTFRLGARRADGTLDRAGFRGGTADMIDCALRLQAPWLEEARGAPRERQETNAWFWTERTTSLMRAADAGDERRVRELLAAGAPLRCVDSFCRTALHRACLRGDARIVAALLEADAAGATVEALDGNGHSPLVVASMRGHEGVVRALLARGARLKPGSSRLLSALHWAANNGHAGVVELLCAAPGAAVDAEESDGDRPLLLASREGREGAVRVLLAHGARQELQTSEDGMTPLHWAANNGHAGVVEQLCAAAGAVVDAQDKDGDSPLISRVATRVLCARC